MLSFAKHTRQPLDESTTSLAKKYLAVHCNLAPMPLVYAHVADDYQLMELRTHEPNIHHYSQYATPETQTFVKIMRDGYAHLRGPIDVTNRPSLSYFLDTLFPKPVGGEAWQEWQNDGENWKKRALFMALNCNEKAGFYELVKGILQTPLRGVCNDGGDTGKDQIDDMCTKLQKLKLSNQMPPVTPQELASIINDLDMTNCDMTETKKEQKAEEKKDESKDAAMESEILPIVKQRLVFTTAKPAADAAGLAGVGNSAAAGAAAVSEGPANSAAPAAEFAAYRKLAGLPATLTPLRIAKQIMFAAMQLQGNEHPAFEKLKTADQTQFTPVNNMLAVDHCVDKLVDKEKLTQLLQAHGEEAAFLAAPAAAAPCGGGGGGGAEIDSAQFLKDMIRMYSKTPPPPPQGAAAGAAGAYLKKYNKPCNALINVILGL